MPNTNTSNAGERTLEEFERFVEARLNNLDTTESYAWVVESHLKATLKDIQDFKITYNAFT